jgi:hypothetical protein
VRGGGLAGATGGGVGPGYILWQFKTRETAILTLGFTNQWQYPGIPGWFGKRSTGSASRPTFTRRRAREGRWDPRRLRRAAI